MTQTQIDPMNIGYGNCFECGTQVTYDRASVHKQEPIRCSACSCFRQIRKFETGATRDSDSTKPDFDGYLSPLVLERFAEYMTLHRKLPDGTTRESSNWKKGIPRDAYMKSMWRHFMDVYTSHHGGVGREDLETALCAMLFNAQGYLHEVLKERNYKK